VLYLKQQCPPPGSLDPRPTTVEKPRATPQEADWCFRLSLEARSAWLRAFRSSVKHLPYATRLSTCGSNAWVQFSPSTGTYRVLSDRCNLRVCPRCKAGSAKRIRESLQHAAAFPDPKNTLFLTFTLKHSRRSLKVQLADLLASFRRLRQRKFWKTSAGSGYAITEVTWNRKTERWHPHLHVVVNAHWIDQRTLSRLWLQVTRSSKIVHVRRCDPRQSPAAYLSKYLAKTPESVLAAGSDRLLEFFDAIKGKRLLNPFGKVPKISSEREHPCAVTDWEPVASLVQLFKARDEGDDWATDLLALLEKAPDAERQAFDPRRIESG